jgi:histidinol dehydrogenase
MSNIVRTPSAGQPIDATYLLELADAINKVASSVSSSPTAKLTSIQTPSAGVQTVKTAEACFVGGYTEVSRGNVSAGTPVTWDYTFPTIAIAGADAGSGVTVMIKSVGQNMVSGTATFSSSGNLSVGLNIILIGIPN